MMQVLRVVSAAILAAAVAGLPAGAQSLPPEPTEAPPAGYSGNQYVDSAGCVFIRAGVGGQVTWVPRVNRDRKLVCGYAPTFPPGMLAAVEATKAPEAAAGTAPEAAPAVIPETTPETSPVDAAKTVAAAPAIAKPAAAKPVAVRSAAPSAGPSAPPSAARDVRLVRAAPVARAATLCLSQQAEVPRYLLSDGRRVTHCAGTAATEPVGWINGLAVPGLTVAPGAAPAAEARRALAADRGAYRVTWQKGEIAAVPAAGPAPAARSAAEPDGYVQVGVFAEPANAQAAIARLKGLGLPVASSTGAQGGRSVKAILAGPFGSAAELRAALGRVRAAGYGDAYIRG